MNVRLQNYAILTAVVLHAPHLHLGKFGDEF